MTDEEFFAKLAEPFPDEEIRYRPYDNLPYLGARSIMTRLDAVCTVRGWWATFHEWSAESVLCRLTIRLPDGTTITKEDLGAYSSGVGKKGGDPGDREKGGFSDALKRAAIQFGIGRSIVAENYPGPKAVRPEPELELATFGKPGSGYDLWRRLQAREGKPGGGGLIGYIREWGVSDGWPADIRQWDTRQALAGYEEAKNYLKRRRVGK